MSVKTCHTDSAASPQRTMRFTVALQNRTDGTICEEGRAPTIEYTFTAAPLTTHIENLFQSFTRAGQKLPCTSIDELCLQGKKGAHIFNTDTPLSVQLNACESSTIYLLLKPSLRAQRTIDGISSDSVKLKEYLFHLRGQMLDPNFLQAFVDLGGLLILLKILEDSKGNTLGYCLGALRNALSYLKATQALLESREAIQSLYNFTYSPTVTVCRLALDLLCTMCTFDESAGISIYEVAEEVGQERGGDMFQHLVHLVSSGDLDIQTNSLTLINNLLQALGSQEKRKEVVHHLEEDFSLREVLKNSSDITNESFLHQLRFYENLTGESVLEYTNEDIKRQLKQYQLQQPFFNILRNELQQAQQAITDSLRYTDFLPADSQEPLQRYTARVSQIEQEYGDRKARVLSSDNVTPLDAIPSEVEILARQVKDQRRRIAEQQQQIKTLELTNFSLQKQVEHHASGKRSAAPPALADILEEKQELRTLRQQALTALDTLRKEQGTIRDVTPKSPRGLHGGVEDSYLLQRQLAEEVEADILEERARYISDRSNWERKESSLNSKIEQLQKELQSRPALPSIPDEQDLTDEDLPNLVALLRRQLAESELKQNELSTNNEKLTHIIFTMKRKYETLRNDSPLPPKRDSVFDASAVSALLRSPIVPPTNREY